MYYIIYKITNTVNKKVYIGKHQTSDLNDNYMGSGKLLIAAIKKYGINSFNKEILYCFYNENEMNKKESELVTEEFCAREDTYNLCPGGKGGFGYINKNGMNLRTGAKLSDTTKKKLSLAKTGKSHSEVTKQKISEKNKLTNSSRGRKTSENLKGKMKTDMHKTRISESLKNKNETRSVLKCPHCGFEGKPPNIYKNHFKKCAGIV